MNKVTLEAARRNNRLTQAEAAKLIGVSVTTLHNWETGKSRPDIVQTRKMCVLYDVDINALIFN